MLWWLWLLMFLSLHTPSHGRSLSFKLKSSIRGPGDWGSCASHVPQCVLFWTDISDVAPRICWRHLLSLALVGWAGPNWDHCYLYPPYLYILVPTAELSHPLVLLKLCMFLLLPTSISVAVFLCLSTTARLANSLLSVCGSPTGS